MPLPLAKTLEARTASERFNPLMLENLSCLDMIVKHYRETNEIDSMQIFGVLAVDAIAFDREMIIAENGFVTGAIESEFVDKDILEKIQSDFRALEKLWQDKLDTIISDAFVFQFQPLSATLRPFVVHVHPSTQGKATNTEVELLEKTSDSLQKLDVNVIGFAMDGDSTYRKLHALFYNEYEKTIGTDASFDKFARITSD